MGRKLFVGNLAFETTESELKEMFSSAGTPEATAVIRDRMTGRSRGFAFVEMSSDEEAQRAVSELNGKELQGRAISVSEARERSERGPDRRPGPSTHGSGGHQAPRGDAPKFRRDGGSRRGLRARKRSL
jgi:RNA recognition motif-containing protein